MKQILVFIAVLLLAACASQKPAVVQMPRPMPGNSIPQERIESVRYGENIKAYPMGRYIEPNNSLVMHEAHTVYRVESTAKWNLHPNSAVRVPAGPIAHIVDPAHQTSPLTPEVIVEIQKQKAATQAVIDQGQRLNQALSQLSQSIAANKKQSDQATVLGEALNATKRRLEALEDQFRKKQSETVLTPPAPSGGTNDW